MATGYSDIDSIISRQDQTINNMEQKQNEIVDSQTAMNVADIERQKENVDKEATKTNRALYTEYKKASNPYGVNAENLVSQGLGNSGYAETTKTNLYNTYQKNVTDTLNSARDAKNELDVAISNAKTTASITKAQNALAIYQQKLELLTQEYQMKNNRDQFEYQKQQDALAQANWEKEFEYQRQQDALAQANWEKEFNLAAKKASASSSSKSKSNTVQLSNQDNVVNTNDSIASQQSDNNGTMVRVIDDHNIVITKDGKSATVSVGSGVSKSGVVEAVKKKYGIDISNYIEE